MAAQPTPETIRPVHGRQQHTITPHNHTRNEERLAGRFNFHRYDDEPGAGW
jgi:hypothetical protein